MIIGQRVKKLRKERNMTQMMLSQLSGISQQAISNMETGRNYPSAETIRLLARVLEVSTSELLGEDAILSEHKLTPREEKMIAAFRDLNPAGQKHLIELAGFYKGTEEFHKK
jgi:transcriptional regulator with XRE-family HTH domain